MIELLAASFQQLVTPSPNQNTKAARISPLLFAHKLRLSLTGKTAQKTWSEVATSLPFALTALESAESW